MVAHLISSHSLSERKACRLIHLSRTGYRYCTKSKDDEALLTRLKALSSEYPRYGYLTLHSLLKSEGLVINKKRTYRLYRQEGLQVRTKKRGKLHRPRVPLSVPNGINQRWSMDFVSDQLATGRRFRVLNIVDDYSREVVGQLSETSISGHRVARFLNQIGLERPLPGSIVCDNGTEFTSKAMFEWSRNTHVKLSFIQPGKPTQNAFVESFNGKFRDQCLNQYWFKSLEEAKAIIDDWREHFNTVRPHSSLNYMTPLAYAKKVA